LPGLASNLGPPNLSLPSSWDYRREPPAPCLVGGSCQKDKMKDGSNSEALSRANRTACPGLLLGGAGNCPLDARAHLWTRVWRLGQLPSASLGWAPPAPHDGSRGRAWPPGPANNENQALGAVKSQVTSHTWKVTSPAREGTAQKGAGSPPQRGTQNKAPRASQALSRGTWVLWVAGGPWGLAGW
jgi:hypothetical protein